VANKSSEPSPHLLHTNPERLEQTRAESGQNLVRSFRNRLEDLERMLRGGRPVSPERFEIGKQVAATRPNSRESRKPFRKHLRNRSAATLV
jgi:poly(3-hydroxyalkanoate) synthetase